MSLSERVTLVIVVAILVIGIGILREIRCRHDDE